MNMTDIFYIIKWFLGFLAIGIAFLPLTFSIFENFKDKGYIFSKIIGIAFMSYFLFILGLLKVLKFSEISVLFSLILFFILNYSLYIYYKKENPLLIIKKSLKIFFIEEIIFLISLFFWSYIRGNFPDIHGLEKYMDFGILNSILRSDYFPPIDMWYTPLPINYYYFGHLVTAVVTKLTLTPSFISYNLMLSTLFALTFTASLSLGMNLFDITKFSIKSTLSGFISAVLISFSGNLTTIYTFFKPFVNEHPVPFWQLPFLPFSFPNNYWYPNATRFIPFTIHEFPIYSFVVSDLHGHVLDIPFVLLTISVVFAFFVGKKLNLLKLIFISFLLSVTYMTNAWDGLIYLLLGIIVLAFLNFYKGHKKLDFSGLNIYNFFFSLVTVLLGFIAFSIPFSINFKPFISGIGLICAPKFLTDLGSFGPFLFETNHCQRSPVWQLLVLYGFFYFFVISFLIFLKRKKNYKFSENHLFVLILTLLSTFLIIIPEFFYIKDIYPLHYRANTMFKLVYEAFMILTLCSSFMMIKLLSDIKNKVLLLLFFMASVFLVSLVLIYPVLAINSYYRDLKNYQSLNGISYLSSLRPQDYRLIDWINKNIKGQPVILEANGDSYTDYARISANTGLPTVIGWPVHEWLWRGTYDVASPRIEDVKILYTTADVNLAKRIINKYDISYAVVSSLEKEKYPNLNENVFLSLGEIVYQSGDAKLYKFNSGGFR